jgi:hypothetical protein
MRSMLEAGREDGRFKVPGLGVSGFGFRVSGFGFRVSDFGFRVRLNLVERLVGHIVRQRSGRQRRICPECACVRALEAQGPEIAEYVVL